MKPDIRLTKLARVLVQYSVGVKRGDRVSITGSTANVPLLREIYKEVLLAGGHPVLHMEFEDQKYLFFTLAKDFQLKDTDPYALHEVETIDARIIVISGLNPHALTSIDAGKKQKAAMAWQPVMETLFRRMEEGFRWVGSACPSPALAQEARMSLEEYAEFVYASMNLNLKDPVRFWRSVSRRQKKICDRLDRVSEMRYVGPDTDLVFSCSGRKWINCDGKFNFPDGEVFTGPVEDSVEGTIRFTYPGIYQGEEIEDIFLRFEKGRVSEARAKKGENLLHRLLEIDEGARVAGEIAIGTNDRIDRFTKNMLFDEKIGGTVHLALGHGYGESGSRNTSAIHWDMLKDMRDGGEIHADGKLIYKNGSFLDTE